MMNIRYKLTNVRLKLKNLTIKKNWSFYENMKKKCPFIKSKYKIK